MKAFLWSCVGFPAALAAVLPEVKVDYNGAKVLRVATGGDALAVQDKLSELGVAEIRSSDEVEAVVPAQNLDAFNALGLDSTVTDENFGSTIAAEQSEFAPYAGGSTIRNR